MAESNVEIANSALSKIGAARIDALSDDNERARACNERFHPIRKAVLREHPWNFAITRVELAVNATGPEWKYTYAFDLPSNILRVIDTNLLSAAWTLEGRQILTDESSCKIIGVLDETNPTKFDSMFDEVFAARLAADIAYRITQNVGLAQQMYALYQQLLRDARFTDSLEGEPRWDEDTGDDTILNQRF